MSSVCTQVPDELWLEILHDLPNAALQSVALTHHNLSRISRPLLFAHCTFRPYAVPCLPANNDNVRWRSDAMLEPILLTRDERDRELERLAFWFSPEIAPYVRSCTLKPLREDSDSGPRKDLMETESPTALLDTVFERLPLFVGLSDLHAYIVHFTKTGLENLCRLPSLSHLDVVFGRTTIEPSDLSPNLRLPHVKRFQFKYARTRFANPPMHHPWLQLLRLDQIAELHLAFAGRLFPDLALTFPVLSSVRSLTLHTLRVGVTWSPANVSAVLAILPKFPGVEIFRMEGRWWQADRCSFEPIPESTLPVIKEYDGPLAMLAVLLARPTLRRVTTHNMFDKQLYTFNVPNVISFTASYLFLKMLDFPELLKTFPLLKDLDVEFPYPPVNSRPHLDPEIMHTVQNLLLQPSLEYLRVRLWRDPLQSTFEAGSEHDTVFLELEQTIDLLRGFIAINGSLAYFWFETHDFLYRWRVPYNFVQFDRGCDA
ncbi:hypothetical protein R3P38DRAFT_2892211 [Favolaschia claudopus]|uniref:F-box domain-containing protein n=1 Tax=Favolaschia claudopus TaxID=2862362 RepID=A0AAW0CUL9_9AGAR